MKAIKVLDKIKRLTEPEQDFIREIEEERINQGLTKFELSTKAFGYKERYNQVLLKCASLSGLQMVKLCEALNLRLIIRTDDKEEI